MIWNLKNVGYFNFLIHVNVSQLDMCFFKYIIFHFLTYLSSHITLPMQSSWDSLLFTSEEHSKAFFSPLSSKWVQVLTRCNTNYIFSPLLVVKKGRRIFFDFDLHSSSGIRAFSVAIFASIEISPLHVVNFMFVQSFWVII